MQKINIYHESKYKQLIIIIIIIIYFIYNNYNNYNNNINFIYKNNNIL